VWFYVTAANNGRPITDAVFYAYETPQTTIYGNGNGYYWLPIAPGSYIGCGAPNYDTVYATFTTSPPAGSGPVPAWGISLPWAGSPWTAQTY
jgi:hypothetical protein